MNNIVSHLLLIPKVEYYMYETVKLCMFLLLSGSHISDCSQHFRVPHRIRDREGGEAWQLHLIQRILFEGID